MISDIMHSFVHDKGKSAERQGRKSTGLRVTAYDSGATETMADCRSLAKSGRGKWNWTRTTRACDNKKKTFYRAYSGHKQ